MRDRDALQVVVLAAVVIALLPISARPALAHYVQTAGRPYVASGGMCVENTANINHGTGTGVFTGWVRPEYAQYAPWGNVDCARSFVREAGQILNLVRLFKWTGSQWMACYDSNNGNWTRNGQRATETRVVVQAIPQTPPCGNGYYLMQVQGQVSNGGWFGGSHTSNQYHFLPS